MARIEDSKGRDDDNSGYTRLLGLPELGQLLSRIHATVIRNGNELESVLAQRCPHRSTGLADLLHGALRLLEQPVEVFFGEALHVGPADHQITADVVILSHGERRVRVIEIKEGDLFDTKKADGELGSLRPLATLLGQRLGYRPSFHLCCFNQEDKSISVRGLKGRFDEDQVMTGRELCTLLGVDYDAVRREREDDIRANFEYLTDELAKIPEIRDAVSRKMGAIAPDGGWR